MNFYIVLSAICAATALVSLTALITFKVAEKSFKKERNELRQTIRRQQKLILFFKNKSKIK